MANPPHQEEEYSIKYCKPKDYTHIKAKGFSLYASIFALCIYISISYIFKFSPYTLFNNHIFWFLISNTLILIIAADYGAFSSSKHKQDLHHDQEYVKHSQTGVHGSSHVSKYEEVENKCIINPEEQMIAQNIEVPERVLEIVTQNEPKKLNGYSNEKKTLLPLLEVDDSYKACDDEKKPIPARIDRRSRSERDNRIKGAVVNESMDKVRRSESMKVEVEVEEANEFSIMTNEELNRKVEEFIQKFNRQIRLQASKNDS